jgi:hypothetical protein
MQFMRCGILKIGRNSISVVIIAFPILVLSLSCFGFFAHGQSETVFTSTDKFDIPVNNSSIRFAVDGTYEQASLENGSWSFLNLRLNNSQRGAEELNLKVSAKDAKVTINSCQINNSTFGGAIVKGARLRYTVVGQGIQVFDLGLDPKGGDWNVIFNGVYMGKNDGWSLSPYGTLTVTGATANVTLSYYGFPVSSGGSGDGFNESILTQHSVVIITIVVVAIAVLLAIVIKTRKRESI